MGHQTNVWFLCFSKTKSNSVTTGCDGFEICWRMILIYLNICLIHSRSFEWEKWFRYCLIMKCSRAWFLTRLILGIPGARAGRISPFGTSLPRRRANLPFRRLPFRRLSFRFLPYLEFVRYTFNNTFFLENVKLTT